MKANLLLTDEAEITRLMLKDVAFDELAMRDSEAHAGCNCDRWGHPCPDYVEHNVQVQPNLSTSGPAKK